MRALMMSLLMLVVVMTGCSGDDDDAANDGTMTTEPSTETTVAVVDTPTTTVPPVEEIAAWETYQVGEPVLIDPDMTLTITGIEVDPELERTPTIPIAGGDRYVLVSGTVDYTGPVQDDAIVSIGEHTLLVPANPPESVAFSSRDNDCHPDADNSVFPTESWDVQWCFAVPAEQSSWKMALDPTSIWGSGTTTNSATSGTSGYEFVWDVNL